MARILAGISFTRSKRLSGFLRFIVEETLLGRGGGLKEYRIATEVYERSESFDPVTDNIVRVEARRLRKALQRFYAAEGVADPISIEVPKGGYQPLFRWRRHLVASGSAVGQHPSTIVQASRSTHCNRCCWKGLAEQILSSLTIPGALSFQHEGIRIISVSLGDGMIIE